LGLNGLFIFEPHRLQLWGAAARHTAFDIAAIQPALVHGVVSDIIWTAHLMVQIQLFHEAIVWLT
jgi:sugar phosphate permease